MNMQADRMTLTEPHAHPAATSLAAFVVGPAGLSVQEAARRLAAHGPNRLSAEHRRGPVMRLLAQFNNVLVFVLLGAAVVTAALQHWVDAGVILAVVIANALIGFAQEGKAESAMAAVRRMLAPRAAVLRMGGGSRWTEPIWFRVKSFSWRQATRSPQIFGQSRPEALRHRRRSGPASRCHSRAGYPC